jgi:hypothetical protein
MKKTLLLLLILSSLNIISGQKSLKNFKGELIFKDCRYYVPINRYLYDTIINYSSIQVGDSFKIEYWTLISPEIELNQKLIPFKFSKKSDSIFLNYYDPVNKLNVSEYSFSLIKHDTIDYSVCCLMFVDSFSADGKIYKKLLNEFDDENRGLKTIYFARILRVIK